MILNPYLKTLPPPRVDLHIPMLCVLLFRPKQKRYIYVVIGERKQFFFEKQ